MGPKKRKPDREYIVQWIIALSVLAGIVGLAIQFFRFGGLVEPGNTGEFGKLSQPITVAQSRPVDFEGR